MTGSSRLTPLTPHSSRGNVFPPPRVHGPHTSTSFPPSTTGEERVEDFLYSESGRGVSRRGLSRVVYRRLVEVVEIYYPRNLETQLRTGGSSIPLGESQIELRQYVVNIRIGVVLRSNTLQEAVDQTSHFRSTERRRYSSEEVLVRNTGRRPSWVTPRHRQTSWYHRKGDGKSTRRTSHGR